MWIKIRDFLFGQVGLLLVFALAVGIFYTLPPSEKQPQTVVRGYSLDEIAPQLDSSLNALRDSLDIVGLSYAVAYQDRLVHAAAFGYADEEGQESLEVFHRFRVASVSKLITGIAVMRLVDQGKLQLQDSVFGEQGLLAAYGYRFSDKRIRDITVEHLLAHTAGWSRNSFGDPVFMSHTVARAMRVPLPVDFTDVAQFVLEHRLPFEPGTYYDYSNFGYCLLGQVIAAASGLPYERYVQEEVLRPMGIRSMAVGGSFAEERLGWEVKYYDRYIDNRRMAFNDANALVPAVYGGTDMNLLGPAGGWVASPISLLKMLSHVNLHPGRADLLSAERILEMVRQYPPGNSPLGWRGTNGEQTWWRTGTLAGASALLVRQDPNLSWAVLINTSGPKTQRFRAASWQLIETHLAKVHSWPEHDAFR